MSIGREEEEPTPSIPMPLDDATRTGAPEDVVDETPGSPRRPTTRSQTGRSTKRRRQERSASPAGRDSPSGTGGRARAHKQHKSLDSPIFHSSTSTSTAASSEHEGSGSLSATSVDSESKDSTPFQTSQITFLDGSLTATANNRADRPGPKSRANLPVPVPNLTKKSRGRRVPTQNNDEAIAGARDGRMYVCQVEGCGKCFHRGEHLKRHIRSIHTHEKPFKCTHGLCNKTFNRHDNLLQHLKVHKGREISPSPSDLEDNNDEPPYRPQEDSQSSSPPSSPRVIPPPPKARMIPKKIAQGVISRSRDTSPGPYSLENIRDKRRSPSPPPNRGTAPTSFRTIYNANSPAPRYGTAAYGSLAGPGIAPSGIFASSSSSNPSRMAVSSLRTEVDMQESPLRALCELAVSSSPVRADP